MTKLSIFDQTFDFWANFLFFTTFLIKLSIFDLNFDFWENFQFLTKILIVDQTFDFWPKFWFWANFQFWPKFLFLTKLSIVEQTFDFWPKFWFLTNISIFDQTFDCWSNFRFLTKLSDYLGVKLCIPLLVQKQIFAHKCVMAASSGHLDNIINLPDNQQHNLEYDLTCIADADSIQVHYYYSIVYEKMVFLI